MTAYDDERVIALLKDAVPAVPDAPDRVASIRAVAGRQRSARWTQSLAAAAAVLLVVGLSSTLARGGPGDVRPADDPIGSMVTALQRQTSVAFDASMTQNGSVPFPASSGVDPATALAGHASGAVAKNGEADIEVTLPSLLFGTTGSLHFLLTGGTSFRSVGPHDGAPAGAKWVRSPGVPDFAEALRSLPMITSLARDARYVRAGSVRGTPTAVYTVTVGKAVLHSATDLVVLVELDSDALPRRITVDLPIATFFGDAGEELPDRSGDAALRDALRRATVHVEVDLFGYGRPVHVTAPPANEVTTDDAVASGLDAKRTAASDAFDACMAHGTESQRLLDTCLREREAVDGHACTGTFESAGVYSFTCEDGTTAEYGASTGRGIPLRGSPPPPTP
jgi:hypothetical protein